MTIVDLLQKLPHGFRFTILALYAGAVFIAGGLAVAHVPLGATNDVLAYIGGALGLVSAVNVPTIRATRQRQLDDEEPA